MKRRLVAAADNTGVPESVLVLRAAEALVDDIERNEALTFPVSVQAKKITRPPNNAKLETESDHGQKGPNANDRLPTTARRDPIL